MCVDCKSTHRPTSIALNTVGGNCAQTNFYMDDCFQGPNYSGDGVFPSTCPTSEYRTNMCEYQSEQAWVQAAAGQPLGIVGCKQYSLCYSQLSDSLIVDSQISATKVRRERRGRERRGRKRKGRGKAKNTSNTYHNRPPTHTPTHPAVSLLTLTR